jgi:hypothetical protein
LASDQPRSSDDQCRVHTLPILTRPKYGHVNMTMACMQ